MSKIKQQSKSSKRWLNEHFRDKYVKRAQQEGLRARSAYKLIEIDERYKLIKTGMSVVDLGAAPGSWSEYVAKKVGLMGKVVAVDILPIVPLKNVVFVQGDFTKEEVITEILQLVNGDASDNKIDLVLSDMAPNTSGIAEIDQARSLMLVDIAFTFALKVLRSNGVFLAKVFQSQDVAELLKKSRGYFREVKIIKPDASRSRSQEVFLLMRGFVLK